MTFTISSLVPEFPVVQIAHAGRVDAVEIDAAFRSAVGIAESTGLRLLLVDCARMTNGPVPAELIAVEQGIVEYFVSHEWRQCFVAPDDVFAAMTVTLWRIAGINRGMAVESRRTQEEALEWLLSEQPPTR